MNDARHAPVMAEEVIAALAPKAGGVYVDATFGAGGYTRRILDAADCSVYAFDRDPTAIAAAQTWAGAYGDRLVLVQRPFDEMADALAERGVMAVDGVVFDIGVSSMQIDEAERGFSFLRDGPLSMRMDGAAEGTAADVVNGADQADLADIFYVYGEERKSRAVARAIVAVREDHPITRTGELAEIVARAVGGPANQPIHPATRVFQALRIFVNDELGQLGRALLAAERMLAPAGRLVVVTFHSLEDRIVKRFFQACAGKAPAASRHAPQPKAAPEPTFRMVHAKALAPSREEIAANPRARSAKLRAGERRAAPASPLEPHDFGAPRLALRHPHLAWR